MRSLIVAAVVSVVATSVVRAEPYMAVREGQKCSGCHTNVTGGGKRTDLAVAHARDILHYPDWFKPLTTPAEAFSGEINKYVSVGGNIRTAYTAVVQDKEDVNGRVDNNVAFRGRLEENNLDVYEGTAFLEVRLIPDILTFYIDQRFAPVTDTREVFGLLRLTHDTFLKVGRMFLPYGLQLQDDAAFIRGGRNGSVTTDFSFEQQQGAVEVGWEPGKFSVIAAVSEGAPRDRDVRVTGTAYTLLDELPVVRNVLLGGSFSRVGPPGTEALVFGFFVGSNLGPLTYLGEIDFREDKNDATGGRTVGSFIHYSELNWLALDWLNVKLAFDYADDDGDYTTRADDSENRISFGIEPFLARFAQVRLFYRVSNGIESNPSHNQDLWSAELHAFF